MTSLTFPDVNVWLAILLENHVHRAAVRQWWNDDDSEVIAIMRFTQIGILRLLTTAAAMNGKPMKMPQAWAAYDRLFDDDRVGFLQEPQGLEERFRRVASDVSASPKLWADCWLLAFAEQSGGTVVTFDQALANRAPRALLLG